MDFIDQEAECSSDCSDSPSLNDEWAEDMEIFINDEEYESDDGVHTFANVVKSIDEEDPQSRLYNRNSVDDREIDNFKEDKYRAEEFRKSLLSSETGEESNLFFSAVIFGIHYLNFNAPASDLLTAASSIKPEKLAELTKIKNDIMLEYTVFGFWEKCLLLNYILSIHFGLFLRFYERRNKYRNQHRKKEILRINFILKYLLAPNKSLMDTSMSETSYSSRKRKICSLLILFTSLLKT